MLTTGVSTLTSCRPCIQSANTKIQPHTSTLAVWTTRFHACALADPATFSSFKRCQLCWQRISMCMLVRWTGGRDIDGTCSWLSSSVHTFPPGVLVVLLHNQREGGTATGCCFAVVCPVIHCRTHFIHNIDNKSFIMHLVTDYKLCSTVFCSLAE